MSYAPYGSKEEFEADVTLAAGLFDILSHNGEEARVLRGIKPGGRAGASLEERKARDAASRLLLVMSLGSSGEAIPAPDRCRHCCRSSGD